MIDLLLALPVSDDYARWLKTSDGWIARLECTPEDIVMLPDGRLFKVTPPDDVVEVCLWVYFQNWKEENGQ